MLFGFVQMLGESSDEAVEEGEKHRIKLKGYNAIVVQHEIDHTNGIMFYDRINEKDPFAIKEGMLVIE